MIEGVNPPSSTYSIGPFSGTYSYDSALSSGASVSGAHLTLMFSPTASFEFHNVTLDLDPDGTPTGAFGEVPIENADGLDPVDDVAFVVEIDIDGNGFDDAVLGIEAGTGVRLEGAELDALNAQLNSGMFDGASFLVREIAFTVGIDVDGDADDDLVVVSRTAIGSMAFGPAEPAPAQVNDGGMTFSLLGLGCLILASLNRVRASRDS